MNNPAIYPPHHPYGGGYSQPQGHMMANAPPQNFPQSSFPPWGFPDQSHNHPSQQPQQRPPQPNYQNQNAGFQRPESRSSGIGPTYDQSRGQQNIQQGHPQPSHPQSQPAPQRPPFLNTSAAENKPATPTASNTPNNVMAQAQSVQMQNAARAVPQPSPTMSPQSQARERARVTVLLDINTMLLQEVVSLQAKGMAGVPANAPQQSPNSPTSADPGALGNSPVDASKSGGGKPASQEYADCMRRLQANLSYLATIADAKKKVNGQLPVGPAIMIPPPHLQESHDLYKKLNQLFPEASQSTLNKAMAFASQQATKP